MASISNNSIQLFTHNVNKTLALVVVTEIVIITRAFLRIIKTAIVNTTAEIASRTFPIRINQVIHQLDV